MIEKQQKITIYYFELHIRGKANLLIIYVCFLQSSDKKFRVENVLWKKYNFGLKKKKEYFFLQL